MSLAGVPRTRIAQLIGLPLETFEKRFAGHLKGGRKIPAARVAALVEKLVRTAERAKLNPDNIPNILAVVKFLAPLHLEELHKAHQPAEKTPDVPLRVEIVGAET